MNSLTLIPIPSHSLHHLRRRLRLLRSSIQMSRLQRKTMSLLEIYSLFRHRLLSRRHIHPLIKNLRRLFQPRPPKFLRGINMRQRNRATYPNSFHYCHRAWAPLLLRVHMNFAVPDLLRFLQALRRWGQVPRLTGNTLVQRPVILMIPHGSHRDSQSRCPKK